MPRTCLTAVCFSFLKKKKKAYCAIRHINKVQSISTGTYNRSTGMIVLRVLWLYKVFCFKTRHLKMREPFFVILLKRTKARAKILNFHSNSIHQCFENFVLSLLQKNVSQFNVLIILIVYSSHADSGS